MNQNQKKDCCGRCWSVVTPVKRYNHLGGLLVVLWFAAAALASYVEDTTHNLVVACLVSIVLAVVARTTGRTKRCPICGSDDLFPSDAPRARSPHGG